MRKTLSILTALVFSVSAAAAHADSITGAFSASGTDSFTSNSVTFTTSGLGAAEVLGDIEGTFATYIAQGTDIQFPDGSTLPYTVGTNTPPSSEFPAGYVMLFSVSGGGVTFTFDMTQYTAGYTVDNNDPTTGCNSGSTCLDITGTGYFVETETGTTTVLGTSGPAAFTIDSQYAKGQTEATTTFAASAGTSAVTPEPSSLALLGTGLIGVVGICRRKLSL